MTDSVNKTPLWRSSQPLHFRPLPHASFKVTRELSDPTAVVLVGATPTREWFNARVMVETTRGEGKLFSPRYGWITAEAARALQPMASAIPLERVPESDFAHNSRQEVLALIKTLREQAARDCAASGRRGRAGRRSFLVLFPLLVMIALGVGAPLEVALLGAFGATFLFWLLWLGRIWSAFDPSREVARLNKIQLAKRNPVEVMEDRIKAGLQVVGALAVTIAAAKVATSGTKPTAKSAAKGAASLGMAAHRALQLPPAAPSRPVQVPRTPCRKCKGKGGWQAENVCIGCGGRGMLGEAGLSPQRYVELGGSPTVCGRCRGSGKGTPAVEWVTCLWCKGRGVQ